MMSVKKQLPSRLHVKKEYDVLISQYEEVSRKLQRKISTLLRTNDINADIKFRVKNFDSYFEKILKLHAQGDSPRLTDVLGIRIICPFLEDIHRVEQTLAANFRIEEIEKKGLKHSFREFGYDSTHILIALPRDILNKHLPYTSKMFEVQIRTILQDAWAEVEHELVYKANFSVLNEPIKRKLASLNAILTLSDVLFQEIREYHRVAQDFGFKLRQSVEKKASQIKGLSLLENMGPAQTNHDRFNLTMPILPEKPLEKLLYEGLQLHSNGQYKEAVDIYSRILRMKAPDVIRSIIYNHRGMAYFVLSDYKKAERDFNRSIQLDNNNIRSYNNRGLCYRTQQKYSQALSDFEISIRINPSAYEGYYMRALTYYDLDDLAKALQDCDEVINILPEFVPAQNLKRMINARLFQ